MLIENKKIGTLVFPPLPDSEGEENVSPHPDGRAWGKACSCCAGRKDDPQGMGHVYQSEVMTGRIGAVFYCIHREDGEHHRVCACYAALNRDQTIGGGE